MWNYLRITLASLCLVLCVGFAGLWMHSYYVYGHLYGRYVLGLERLILANEAGQVMISWEPDLTQGEAPFRRKKELTWSSTRPEENNKQIQNSIHDLGYFGFHAKKYIPDVWVVKAPHWFLVLVTGALAVLLKPKPRLKFSLLELLTLTTVGAVVLGGVVALARLGS